MPVSKNKRKNGKVAGRRKVRPVSVIVSPNKADSLSLPLYVALDAAKRGQAVEQHFHDCAAAFNVGYLLLSRKQNISPESATVALVKHGLDLLKDCNKDLNKLADFDGFSEALNLVDELARMSTERQYRESIDELMTYAQVLDVETQ